MNAYHKRYSISQATHKIEGRILPPLILWMLGVPGSIVIILWFFFFRG